MRWVYLVLFILVFSLVVASVSGSETYTVENNETISYNYGFDVSVLNSTVLEHCVGYSYDYSVGVYGSYVFVRCLGWSAVAKVYVNNTVFENRYAGVCYAVKPGEAVVKINPPGLYTPEQLFTLLLFIAIIILFSKLIDPYVAFAIACGTMMIISIIYYKDTNMFFLFLFGMTISLALRNYLR